MYAIDDEPSHPVQVAKLAVELFDELKTLHCLDDNAREYLEAAAYLHDIGWSVSGSKHHKHSYNLIVQHRIPGFSDNELQIIANVARYHRKAEPAMTHGTFAELEKNDRDLVEKLSAILRLADGLDRSHSDAVEKVMCTVHDSVVDLTIVSDDDCGFELYGLEKKRGMFERVYQKPILVKVQAR
jgi:exopolyphosphatase/guanosine-5'-triphosphate,3'-diphosphate pyrophosphatase